mgnify:FL=1
MQRSLSGGERKRWMIFCFVSCAIMVACLTSPAFASNVWSGTHANDSWDLTGFLDRIMDVYNLIKAICAPLAVCSIAGGGFEVLFGNEQEQSKGMARIKYTLMAVAAIFLLPGVINIGYDLAKNFMWDPNNPDYVP